MASAAAALHRPAASPPGPDLPSEVDRPSHAQVDDLPWTRTRVQGRTATYAHRGHGLPTVLLHGWGLGHRAYRHAIDRLVDLGCEVWAPALPGFGGTTGLPAGADLHAYADWVAAFLEAVDVPGPVLLVGHSFGGGVGIATTHRHEERVRALVLVNSIGGATWREPDGEADARLLADRPWWDWGLHFPRDLLPWHEGRRVLPVVLREAVPNLLRNPVAMVRAGELARTADLTQELEELKRRELPVLALWGTRDGVVPKASFDALCRAVGADGQVVEGTHSWLLADPVAFGEVITNAVEVARLAHQQGSTPPEGEVHGLRARWRRRRAARAARRAGTGAPAPDPPRGGPW